MEKNRSFITKSSARPDHGLLAFRLIVLVASLAVLASPSLASAHEKWFVDSRDYPIRPELLFSLPTVVALSVAGLALAALVILRRVVRDPLFPNPPWLRPLNASVQAVVGIQTAISLVFMAGQGWLLAPHLNAPRGFLGIVLLALQIFISFTFVTGWFTRLGGALLIGLVVFALALFPPALVAEQALFVGIGIYFLILGRGLFRPVGTLMRRIDAFWSPYRHLALPALRIFTGISILVLAFTEKLLDPALAVAFLHTRPEFNFMRLLGFSGFTDELFVYAAASVEATVGVLLIAGVLPRLVILFMWVPFNIAIPLLPPEELLGHLPILAVMYAVFLQGPGELALPGEPIARKAPKPARVEMTAQREVEVA